MYSDLTNRQQEILELLIKDALEKGYPPSVREIGARIGLSSPSTVHTHLSKLEDKGYIKRDPSKPRAIEIAPNLLEKHNSETINVSHDLIDIPLVGSVAAGAPILAEQNIEETYALPTNLIGDLGSYMLKVRGDSMIEAGILDGDYVLVQEQPDARNGQIVVALIEDEATVKTFYREQNRIRLQPENSSMEPIYCENPAILGVVIGLFRML